MACLGTEALDPEFGTPVDAPETSGVHDVVGVVARCQFQELSVDELGDLMVVLGGE